MKAEIESLLKNTGSQAVLRDSSTLQMNKLFVRSAKASAVIGGRPAKALFEVCLRQGATDAQSVIQA